MQITLFVALGGAIGAALRHLVGVLLVGILHTETMYATFTVNVVGCFVAGALLGFAVHHWSPTEAARAFVFVGVLGGFTTFSAFSADTVLLIERVAWLGASAYVLGSVLLSVAAFLVALKLMRIMLT
jgi:CrcB protein